MNLYAKTLAVLIAVTPCSGASASDAHSIVSRAAARHGVPQGLAHAVINAESRHNCNARGRGGALGLGQLTPGTARSLGVRNPLNCEQNAEGAMKYLARMFQQAHGDTCRALSAYNTGRVSGCTAYGRKVMGRKRH